MYNLSCSTSLVNEVKVLAMKRGFVNVDLSGIKGNRTSRVVLQMTMFVSRKFAPS